VDVQGDAEPAALVQPRVPDVRVELLLVQPEDVGDVVDRGDDPARGVGAHGVDADDADVGALARRDRVGDHLEVLAPADGVHHHPDVVVLAVEAVQELHEDRPVAAREAAPQIEGQRRAVVARLGEFGDRGRGACGAAVRRATAGPQEQACTGGPGELEQSSA
jgi:hypothetical protein